MLLYDKPHRTYDEQLQLLAGRGLTWHDRERALELLRSVGYYRLGAYVYPFRELLPVSEQRVGSPVRFRSSFIRPGTTMEQVEALWGFDRALRLLVLDGVETVETGLRTQVAYVLGRRDTFGHVHQQALENSACSWRHPRTGRGAFDEWLQAYAGLQHRARNEDFVRHHLAKYGGPLPVWVAVEFMDFGGLTRLFSLMKKADQRVIAHQLGVEGGPFFSDWMRGVGHVRNVAAHHSRLWNRTLTQKFRHPRPAQVNQELHHLIGIDTLDRVYPALAVIAYLAHHVDPRSSWPGKVRQLLAGFPELPGLSIEEGMGAPRGWAQLPLWRDRAG